MRDSLKTLIIRFILPGLALMLCARAAARFHYVAELSTHFTAHCVMAAGASFMLLLLLGARYRQLFITGLFCAAFSYYAALPLLPRDVTPSARSDELRILQWNVLYNNPDAGQEIAALAKRTHADIVVLQEVSPLVAGQLAPLEQLYPHSIIQPAEGAFGMAIFSAMPMQKKTRIRFANSWNNHTEIMLYTPASQIPFTLTELHAVPPSGKQNAAQRNAELEQIAALVANEKTTSRLLVGDLNITPYSPHFAELEHASGLKSSLRGTIPIGTWPDFLPVWLRIPIDHLLVSDNVEILDRRVERLAGSDHMPVFTHLKLHAPDDL